MQNELKTFLEEEYKSFSVKHHGTIYIGGEFCCGGDYCDGNHEENMQQLKDHDQRLIQKVVEMANKQVTFVMNGEVMTSRTDLINNLTI